MTSPRNADNSVKQPQPKVRSERFFKLHDFWYFATREGTAVGPFDLKEAAEAAVADYIEFIEKSDSETRALFIPDHCAA